MFLPCSSGWELLLPWLWFLQHWLQCFYNSQPRTQTPCPALLYLAMQLTSELKGLTEGQRCRLPNCSYKWRSKSLLTADAACNPWRSLKSPTLRKSVLNHPLGLLRPIKKLPSLCLFFFYLQVRNYRTNPESKEKNKSKQSPDLPWSVLKILQDALKFQEKKVQT